MLHHSKMLTFIIPTNDTNGSYPLVSSIINSNGWSKSDCEIIIVFNNCSEERFIKSNQLFKKLQIPIYSFYIPKGTISSARNLGIQKARGKYIIHMDADCLIDKQYIQQLKTILHSKKIDILRGAIKFKSRDHLLSRANCEIRDLVYRTRVNVCYTPNLVVHRKVYDKVNYFNEELFHGEDNEWSLRANISGFIPSYCKELLILHQDKETVQKIIRTHFLYGVSRVYRYKKFIRKSAKNNILTNLEFLSKLMGEIPDLQSIKNIDMKLGIYSLYVIRDLGVFYGLVKWRKL